MKFFRLMTAATAILAATLVAEADPGRWQNEGWTTDFSKTLIDFAEVVSGGPPRDGIPSIDNPKFIPISEERTIAGNEPVILLEAGGAVKVYPLRILTWHEIVNDVAGNVPVAVTFCPLCNASIVFDRRAGDVVLEFGTTGKLRNSDLIMYDRSTDSWWQQFTGTAIVGFYRGTKLKLLPSRVTSFASAGKDYPDAEVLIPTNPEMRDYGRNPYAGYDSASAPFLYRGDMPENIGAMARVVIIRTDGKPIIVSLAKVTREGYSENGYEVTWHVGVASALDQSRISESRDVGGVRVTRNGEDIAHDVTFAFVAHAFHPDVPIIIE